MTLIVEDGTNVANANSYNARADLIAYAALRGVTIPDDATTDVIAIKAMDWLDEQPFKGQETYDTQTLKFPRQGLIKNFVARPSDVIPVEIKTAQCEATLLIFQGIDLWPNRAPEQYVKSEKIGPIETEYFAPPTYGAYAPRLAALLRPFVGIGALQVSRA